MREKVMLYLAGGLAEPDIARAIGICQNTLRKHFEDELATGRARKIAANLDRLDQAAANGNVTAMKHLDSKFGIASAAASFDPPPARPRKAGKKEEAAEAATTAGAGTDWGDDLRPPTGPLN